MVRRAGEENRTTNFFRTERYVQINEQWYFMTRGGSQEGPFRNRMEAEESLLLFIAVRNSTLDHEQTALASKVNALANKRSDTGFPFGQVAKVETAPFNVRRIEFTPVAQDVQELDGAKASSANDSFHFCCL
ncbi:MAG: DUF6316 family protein [Pseudomonadales bacterium]